MQNDTVETTTASAKALDTDSNAVRHLDARFRRPLMSFFNRRIQDRSEAEDMTQEVFIRLLRAATTSRVERLEAFVFSIASNLLKDRARSIGRRQRVCPPTTPGLTDELVREAMEDRTPERVLIGRESLNAVMASLDALEPRTRNIFILFRLERLKHKEIAALYGISTSTVEKHVMKATLHLARHFGDDKI